MIVVGIIVEQESLAVHAIKMGLLDSVDVCWSCGQENLCAPMSAWVMVMEHNTELVIKREHFRQPVPARDLENAHTVQNPHLL